MFITERIIQIVAPHHCIGCNTEGSLLCDWCKPEAFPGLPSRCYLCYRLTKSFTTCRSCKKRSRPNNVWVATQYDDLAKELIHKFKYLRSRSGSVLIADALDQVVSEIDSKILVAHISTATSRRRQRGYDQAELIAGQFAKSRNLKHCTLLARRGQTRQVGSSRSDRRIQLKDAFYVPRRVLVEGVSVLLVDDMTTTGATLESATKTLKEAGAKKVHAAIFAQKTA